MPLCDPEARDDAPLDLLASLWPLAHLPYVIIFNLPRLICTSDRVTFI
jgi:hypothetical protein